MYIHIRTCNEFLVIYIGSFDTPSTLPNSVFCEFCGRTAHSKHLCKSVPSVGEKIFPQNARNTRNLLAEKSLPQMSTDVHRLGGYGIPAIPTLPNSVYSVNSVGEQRTITICVNPCHLWEKRYSRRTHTRNLQAEKSLPQMSTDVHRLGGYGIPAIPTLPNSVYFVNSVGEQRTPTICVHPCHLWEVNAHQICCEKLCANPVTCNANIVQAPSA